MKNPLRLSVFAAALAAALSASAQTTAYSNLGTAPNVYTNSNYYSLSSPGLSVRFVAAATGTLSGFSGALNNTSAGMATPYTLSFYADGTSSTRGTLLASYSGTTSGQSVTSTSALSSVAISGGPAMVAGTAYWVDVTGVSNHFNWNFSNSADGRILTNGVSGSGGSYTDGARLPAFAVSVSPVPEPAPLVAIGLSGFTLLRRRKRA